VTEDGHSVRQSTEVTVYEFWELKKERKKRELSLQ